MAEEKDPGEEQVKNKQEAISTENQLNRLSQQQSDFQKAITEHINSQVKATKELAEVNRESNKNISNMAASMSELGSKSREVVQNIKDMSPEMQQALLKETELKIAVMKTAEERSAAGTKATKEGEERNKINKRAMEDMQDLWTKATRAVDDYQKNLAKTSPHHAAMNTNIAGILTGAKSLSGAADSIKGAITGLAGTAGGIGGLIGMIFYGEMKQAEFTAIGQTAAQQFDQIGGHTDALAGRMMGLVKGLSLAGAASKEAMLSVAAGFASTGVSAKQAKEEIEGFSSAFGNDLMIASLAADKALELPEGTFAKLSGTIAKDFNVSAKEAFISLQNIAGAAREAGLSEVTFMQQSMEAASSLRLLNANAESVMTTQLSMAKAMKAAKFSTAFSGEYAAAGTAGVTSAIAGMSDGLKAVIGEKVYGKEGLGAIYAMNSPLGRDNQEQLNVSKIMQAMMEEFKLDRNSENYAATMSFQLQKLFPQLGTAGADTMMQVDEDMRLGKEIDEEQLKKLNVAFKSEGSKTSAIVLALENIKQAIADTMVGLLLLVIDGLKLLYSSTMYGWAKLSAALSMPGSDIKKSYEEEAEVRFGDIARQGGDAETHKKVVYDSMAKAWEHSKNLILLGLNGGNAGNPEAESTEKIRQIRARRALLQPSEEDEEAARRSFEARERRRRRGPTPEGVPKLLDNNMNPLPDIPTDPILANSPVSGGKRWTAEVRFVEIRDNNNENWFSGTPEK